MYKYLFGPVPSRRLGMSLGVDLVPRKACSLNCVYCEVGKTTILTTERKEFYPQDAIIRELDHYFQNSPDPDYITFSGYGEPTLNTALGGIIHFIKSQKPHIPIAVLTNGTLFQDKKVRTELLEADLVMPSLDAATQEVFEKINRPEKSLHIEDYIQGLVDFRREFPGTINLEIFILPGYNDQESELIALQAAILKIKPDGVQLNTLDRPGTESGLQPATQEELMRIIDFWQLDNVQIIAKVKERKKAQAYRKDTATAILETIDRRPCTLEDLSEILGLHVNEINKYLSVLETEGKIESIPQQRGLFYQKKNR